MPEPWPCQICIARSNLLRGNPGEGDIGGLYVAHADRLPPTCIDLHTGLIQGHRKQTAGIGVLRGHQRMRDLGCTRAPRLGSFERIAGKSHVRTRWLRCPHSPALPRFDDIDSEIGTDGLRVVMRFQKFGDTQIVRSDIGEQLPAFGSSAAPW
ncbi:hypothetical protein [Xanthomonas hortorum]|uniref:hypothetical protein n=1 Tax=Xanthomonas hortorum TaxID=56454 RepID=UPI003CCF175F